MTESSAALPQLRPLMFSIAYRMLGSVTEAEDIVQDAYLRLHERALAGEVIDRPEAYASTVTTRLAIDALRSARRNREVYTGTWLPEPLPDAEQVRIGQRPDSQAAGDVPVDRLGQSLQLGALGEELARGGQHAAPGRGQRHAGVSALEELDPEALLERPDLGGEGGLA